MLPQAAAAARHPRASSGPTRCGSASSGSTSTPRRSASSSARTTTATATSAPRCWTSSPTRGKMQNPVTGSGGMLVGTVEEVGPESPLGLAGGRPGRHPGLAHPDPAGHRGRPRPAGTAAASRSRATATPSCSAARSRRSCPTTCRPELSLAVMDVCGAPALTAAGRWPARRRRAAPTVAVIGGARQVRLAQPRRGPRRRRRAAPSASSRTEAEADLLDGAGLADEVVVADARDPIALRDAVTAAGGPADVTVVCVDVPGCEGGAILATAEGGTVIFFSMATSLLRRRARRRGPGRRRHDAGRQRLRPRPRGVRAGPAARPRRRPRPLRGETRDGSEAHQLELDPVTVAQGARPGPHRPAARSSRLAQQHTTVSVERATLRLAGLERRRRRRHPVGQPARRRRPRRRRARARRRAAGVGRPAPRRGRRPVDARPEGRAPARCASGCPRARDADARPQRGPQGRSAPGITPHRRAPRRARADDRARSATPQRKPWIYLIVATGDIYEDIPQAQAAAREGADVIAVIRSHRPVAARLRARGRDPRGLRRHLRHAGELPADAGGARRDQHASSAATCG